MMDEIFHSTNAHDGVAASKVFLSQLYEKPNTISVVSTHYAELTKIYDGRVSAQQLVATESKGVLTYTYKVAPGVSSLSSVMEILEERGLLAKKEKDVVDTDSPEPTPGSAA
jgi:DNA mismatch repair ATPase MutS